RWPVARPQHAARWCDQHHRPGLLASGVHRAGAHRAADARPDPRHAGIHPAERAAPDATERPDAPAGFPADPPGGYRPHPGTRRPAGRDLRGVLIPGTGALAGAAEPPESLPPPGRRVRQYRVSSTALRTRSFWNIRARWDS